MLVGVPGETSPDETRVALVPSDLPLLKKAGIQVLMRKGAGLRAGYPDEAYTKGGANLAESNEEVYAAADLVARVRSLGASPDGREDIGRMKDGQVLVAFCDPLGEPAVLEEAARARLRVFAMELVPRITRAQSMDVLSSMATVAGYKAVLIAAAALPKMFPMMMTAAGTHRPGQGLRHRRRRRRAAGHRHGAAPRRRGPGLRRAPRGQGAGREPRRPLRRDRARGRRVRRRAGLRQGPGRGLLQAAARADGRGGRRERRGDHHRADPGKAGPDAGHRGDGAGHGPRLGHRRPRRRARRQLRASPRPARPSWRAA